VITDNTVNELNAVDKPDDRRQFFRIDDEVGLLVKVLSTNEMSSQLASLKKKRAEFHTINQFSFEQERMRPELQTIEAKSPALGRYINMLRGQLTTLATMVANNPDIPSERTHNVNISGQGLRFIHHAPIEIGTIIELDLRLFPSQICTALLGKVVQSEAHSEHKFIIAIEYYALEEQDREILLKHIHGLQMSSLARKQAVI